MPWEQSFIYGLVSDRKNTASWLARALGSNHSTVDASSCWRKDVHVKPKYMCFMNFSRLRTLPSRMIARISGMNSYYTLSLRCLVPSMGSKNRYLAFHSFLSLSEFYGIIERVQLDLVTRKDTGLMAPLSSVGGNYARSPWIFVEQHV